ncbi:pentatricopeptide repeat-containing protein At2g27610-like [Magnolia sinica]|uniref:pentatricopeptide repeat-containing protein At2g27610-like n=1 Tax=Magnolia sinica TaxID=86752 RepID=UPI002657C161|nr:pentatricopeptide repeat-containing protein At2g27610-like [Magnolia sinica]
MTFSRFLRACGNSKCILKGKTVHSQMIASGFIPDVYTNNHLISMYVKYEILDDARRVLEQMPERNLISWTLLVSGYANMGLGKDALECFRSLLADGFSPNHFTYVAVLSACAGIGAARTGKEIHGRIYRFEQDLNSFVRNSLVTVYAKCGLIGSAQIVFDGIPCPDLVSWSSILSGYYQFGEYKEALRLFLQLRRAGVKGNEFTSASVLGACADLADLIVGKQVHCHVIKCGVRLDRFVATGIVNLYAKCGELGDAQRIFLELDEPGLASWTALVGGYTQQGEGRKAIDLFRMLHLSALKPNNHVFSSVLAACANSFAIKEGKQLHSLILKSGFKLVSFIGNAIIDLYAKCGLLEESSKVFYEMMERDVVSWNALFAGHVQHGHFGEAIELLHQMLHEGMQPSIYTYSSILNLCGDLPATEWGKQTHCSIIKPGFDTDVVVGSALVDMYAKCGRLSDARKVFNNLNIKNLVSWNTMIIGYAQHGIGKEALEMFDDMQRGGAKPNDITFLGVLTACVHVGLVKDGQRYFNSMIRDHCITPGIDHFACMVNLFARVGQVRRAYEFILSMPVVPDKVVWRCLLAGCVTHKNVDIGRCAAECILKIDPEDVSAYVMLSTIYADAEMWDQMAEVRKVMKEKGLKKDPACSWIEVKNWVHSFIAGDAAHSHRDIIHETLNGLTVQILDAGYVPNTFLLHDGE